MKGQGHTRLLRLAVVIALALVATAIGARAARADGWIDLYDEGVWPGEQTIVQGETVHFVNEGDHAHRVLSANGLLDSGTIPPNGSYSATVTVPGTYTWTSPGEDGIGGIVRVLATRLAGGDDTPASDHIPSVPFPADDPSDFDVDATYGETASRTHILVGFTPGATVAQANAALQAAGGQIVGALPGLGVLELEVPSWWEGTWDGVPSPFDDTYIDWSYSGVHAAVDALRGLPGVDFATLDFRAAPTSVSPSAEQSAKDEGWDWASPADQGGNWGVKTARFPQAWNLLEPTRAAQSGSPIVTAIVDDGFHDGVDDLPNLTILPQLCAGDDCESLTNGTSDAGRDHGTYSASLVGADYAATPDGDPKHARGITGANPFAKMIGVPIAGAEADGGAADHVAWSSAHMIQTFDLLLRSNQPGLRVVNYSAAAVQLTDGSGHLWTDGQTPYWWQRHPGKTCGPGALDDAGTLTDANGVDTWCTPDTADDWQAEMANLGKLAARVAREAAQRNVLIVQAAGNSSGAFCPPSGTACLGPIQAASESEFAWVSKHWDAVGGGLPNPILSVEAVDPNGQRAPFSNLGDVAAPGTSIMGETGNGTYETGSGTSAAAPLVSALAGYLLAQNPSLSVGQLRARILQTGTAPRASVLGDANFTWQERDRTGLDEDGDGLLDYRTDPAQVDDQKYVVDFDACGSTAHNQPAVSYRWTIDQATQAPTSSCTFTWTFDSQGTHSVDLATTNADGDTSTFSEPVKVKDLLVVSIGDSIGSGEGNPDVAKGGLISGIFDSATWENERCHRSALAGPAQAARLFEQGDVHSSVTFLHLACSGGRMQGDTDADGNLLPGDAGTGGLLTPYEGIAPPDGVCVATNHVTGCLPPQLYEAGRITARRTPDALLISIGANDMTFSTILTDCLKPGNDCSTGEGRTVFENRIALLPARYDRLAAEIKRQWPDLPADHVFITTYPDPTHDQTGAVDLSCAGVGGITTVEANWAAQTVVPALNSAVVTNAVREGWTPIYEIGDDFDTHGYCSTNTWFVSIGGSFDNQGGRDGAFHPNFAGHSDYARRIDEWVRRVLELPAVDAVVPNRDTAPRIDAYAAALATAGDDTTLLDTNDPSADGDRRVVYTRDADGATIEKPDTTMSSIPRNHAEPDGTIDMRDFRRFRDAWLRSCELTDGTDANDPACPDTSRIHLDGADDNPKKDFNWDDCADGCDTPETAWSRFDFNGDGRVDVTDQAPVPLQADGTSLTDGSTNRMTDLEVLKTKFVHDANAAEGWTENDLHDLLDSGDLEIHASDAFHKGASSETVRVVEKNGRQIGPTRTLTRVAGSIVVSVPLGGENSDYHVVAEAKTDEGTIGSVSDDFSLAAGSDYRIDLCSGLTLALDPSQLTADGSATTNVTAQLQKCGADDIAGKKITFSVDKPAGGSFDLTPDKTDGSGKAVARFVAGTTTGTYTIKATVDLGDGKTVDAEAELTLSAPVTIKYVWKQTIDDWTESGSTRWSSSSATQPDCTFPNVVDYCIDASTVTLTNQLNGGIEKAGSLVGGGNAFSVTEAVTDSTAESNSTWTVSKPDGKTEDGARHALWFVTDPNAYQAHPVTSVSSTVASDGLQVKGIDSIGALPYHYLLASGDPGTKIDPIEIGSAKNALLLIPNGGPLSFGSPKDTTITFKRLDDGTFAPYTSCHTVDEDISTSAGYYSASDAGEWIPGATTIDRKTDYAPGDRPLPVGPGHLRVHYAFAAVAAAKGTTPGEPTLPDCTQNNPPKAAFTYTPAAPTEGHQVHFVDHSTDPEQDFESYTWDFGDGKTGAGAAPWHMYGDNGTYTVKETVTDAKGNSDTATQVVTVDNLPPSASIDGATAKVGTTLQFTYRILDPGTVDKASLEYHITSTNAAFPTLGGTDEADVFVQTVTGLPVGTYPVTLTVKDKDGASDSATAVLVVTPGDPPPHQEEQDDLPYQTCSPDVGLDLQEILFLDEVNEYRAQNGLQPVLPSPALTKAAVVHADDMAAHNFLDHPGTDGSMPWDRAWAQGYPKTASVGENVSEGETAEDVLWAWRSSLHGHNENMLDPRWKAIGIARAKGSIWRWSTEYGDTLDCGAASPAPQALARTTAAKAPAGAVPIVADAPAPAEESHGGTEVVRRAAHAAAARPATPLQGFAPLATTTAMPDYAPIAAFTISNLDPFQGKPVTFANRSVEADGTPVAATIDFDDGTAADPTSVPAGGSVDHRYPTTRYAGPALHATNARGTTDVSDFVYVDSLPTPSLYFIGDAVGFTGKTMQLRARLVDGSVPVPGKPVTFAYDGATQTATTDTDGIGTVTADLTGAAPGWHDLTLSFVRDADFDSTTTHDSFQVKVNHPPTVVAGGPYEVGIGTSLLLDATRTTDADFIDGDQIVSYDWDLNGDGTFDDVHGPTPLPVNWDDVQAEVCGGTCSPTRSYTIALRATDARGDSSTGTAKVEVVSDFALFLGGDGHTVVPGASNSFAVTVVASTGFTAPVTLTANDLPAGITASFSVNPVMPGQVSVLTLTASSSATDGSFPIHLTGTGGGITHTISDSIDVAFGLIPVCTGTIDGSVTDLDTGAPVANVLIYDQYSGVAASTDSSGRYVLHDVTLGYNNAPASHYVTATKAGSFGDGQYVTAFCGGVAHLALHTRVIGYGTLTGHVVEGVLDPNDASKVVPTSKPLPQAQILASMNSWQTVNRYLPVDDNGAFGAQLELGRDNAPVNWGVTATAPGYWTESKYVSIASDTPADTTLALVKQCSGTVLGGKVTYDPGNAPVPNHLVELFLGGGDELTTITDADGNYHFDRSILLGFHNSPVSYTIRPKVNDDDPPGSQARSGIIALTHCGDTAGADLQIVPGTESFASIDGHVTDEETHQPIKDVSLTGILPSGVPVATDENGYFHAEHLSLGYNTSSGSRTIGVVVPGYWGTSRFVSLTANTTTHVEIAVLKEKYGAVHGTVTDAATGAPIPNASVADYCGQGSHVCTTTGKDGTYAQTKVELGNRNASVAVSLGAGANGYWGVTRTVTIGAGSDPQVDFQLLRKCTPAKIVGTVVNAQTQAPIAGATVQAGSIQVQTNASGRFSVENIQPGTNNTPAQVGLTASAPGFFSQSKTVTIFCGATISVDFGTRQTNLGSIVGTVTNTDTGQPLANVFVGSEFGGSAQTDAQGNYRIDGVPLGDLNADKDWGVTASPTGFRPQTKVVTAKANVEVRADFAFSATANHVPVAADVTTTTPEDVNATVTGVGSDADGDPLTYTITQYPQHGDVTGAGPDFTYDPAPDFNGTDTFRYVVNDGAATSAPATATITVTPVQDPPVASVDHVTTPQDTPLTIPVAAILANDTDVDGDTVSLESVEPHGSTFGTVVWDGGDTVTYTPDAGFTGEANFRYSISDGHGNTASSNVYIDVTKVAGKPVCPDASLAGFLGSAVTGTLACTDPDGDALTYAAVSQPAHGAVAVTAGGAFTYTPAAGFSGTDSFTYTATDGVLTSREATVTIAIAAPNHAPTAAGDAYSVAEDATLSLAAPGVLANDADADGDALTAQLVTPPAHGTLSLQPTGALSYAPAANFNGADSFTYRASDGAASSAPVTVTLTVTPVDDPPAGTFDSYAAQEDTPLTVAAPGVLGNDTDLDGDALTAQLALPAAHGALDLHADGSFTYTPAAHWSGTDGFSYRASDGTLQSGVVSVVITVAPVAHAPVAQDVSVGTDEDVPVPVTLAATDADGDPLTYRVVGGPAHGAVTGTGASRTYTPAPNFHGTDSFAYVANDGGRDSAPATVTVDVASVDDAPVAHAVSATTPEDTPVGVQLDATDVDGDALTYEVVDGPEHGTFAGGVYTPAPDYDGPDSFTYRASDGTLASGTATVAIQVTLVDDAPTADDLALQTDEDTQLTLTLAARDVEGDPLTYAIAAQPKHGALTGTAPALRYVPDANYHGSDSFTYTASDGTLSSAVATVTIAVASVNDAPTAQDVTAATDEDTAVTVRLGGADVDGDAIAYELVAPPAHGSITGDGANRTYTPAADWNGTDSFTYRTFDGALRSTVATATVTVRPVNDAPVAQDGAVTTAEDTPVVVTLTASDVDGPSPSVAVVAGPQHGTFAGGTYTPDANFNGTDTLTFRASDGELQSSVATVTITVTPVNDAPTAPAVNVATDEDTATAIVLGGADVDGDQLGWTLDSQPAHGSLAGSAPGLFYTPAPDYHGTDTFTYHVSDGTLASGTATVTIDVRSVDDAPVALDRSVSTTAATPVAVELGGTDADGDSLTFEVATQPAHGTITGTAPHLVYTPAAGFSGRDTFTYTAFDGSLRSSPATVGISVDASVNHAPTVVLAPTSGSEASTIALTAVGSDPDHDPLSFTWTTDAGTIVGSGATATLTVDDGPSVAHVVVVVSDGAGGSAVDRQTVTVGNVAPTARASAQPLPAYWGVPVHFTGTATDPSRADTAAGLQPKWDLGDSTVSSSAKPDHTYSQPGTYHATFSARDKDGGLGSAAVDVPVGKRTASLEFTGSWIQHCGSSVLSAQLRDTVDPSTGSLAGKTITFASGGQIWTAVTDRKGVAAVAGNPLFFGGTVVIAFGGDALYQPVSIEAQVSVTLDFGDGTGFFAVGPAAAQVGAKVTFWSSQWAKSNVSSAPSSFKGWVTGGGAPGCGHAWTAAPGNSGNPPSKLPQYLALVVTDHVTKSGSTIAGNTTHIVVVKTSSGYAPNPGHDGTGQVVAIIC